MKMEKQMVGFSKASRGRKPLKDWNDTGWRT